MPTSSAADRSLQVFLVENDPETLRTMRRALERAGHRVTCAVTVGDALTSIPSSGCDVLLSDIGLPDGNGWELLKRLRQTRYVYAIAMSGHGSPADLLASRDAGFQEHLHKPFTTEQLYAALEKAFTARPAAGPDESVAVT